MSKAASYAQWSLEPYCIGLKLRSLRNSKRLTLSRLAAETGLSTALLSKLETDRMIPTLPTLATIARVYGVGMDYFFNEPSRHKLSITRKAHLQGNGRGMEPVKVTPLNADGEGFRLVAQVVEFPPGGSTVAMNAFEETGAVIYVLEGTPAPGRGRHARGARCGRLRVHGKRDAAGLERRRQASLPDSRGASQGRARETLSRSEKCTPCPILSALLAERVGYPAATLKCRINTCAVGDDLLRRQRLLLQRDGARKQQIVFKMHMPVQIGLEGLEAVVEANCRWASAGPGNKSARGRAHLFQQTGRALVLVNHCLDGTLD